VFDGIGLAKFANGGSILGSSQAAFKNNARHKSGQNGLKNTLI
jgi:hypothetical protein